MSCFKPLLDLLFYNVKFLNRFIPSNFIVTLHETMLLRTQIKLSVLIAIVY